MIATALAAFVGCFTAVAVLAEVQNPNKALRYFFAFVVGLVVAVLLALFVGWLAGVLHLIHG